MKKMNLLLANAFYCEGLRNTKYKWNVICRVSGSKPPVFPEHHWCKQEDLDLHSAAHKCS